MTINIGGPFKIESKPYKFLGRKIAAKPVTESRVTPVKSETTDTAKQTTVKDTKKDTTPEPAQPLAQTEKNNLLPIVIILSIVIGCVAIVSIRKKIS